MLVDQPRTSEGHKKHFWCHCHKEKPNGFWSHPQSSYGKTNLLLPFGTKYGVRHPLDAHQTAVQEKSRTRLLLELALVQDDQGPHQEKTVATGLLLWPLRMAGHHISKFYASLILVLKKNYPHRFNPHPPFKKEKDFSRAGIFPEQRVCVIKSLNEGHFPWAGLGGGRGSDSGDRLGM